MQGVKLSSLKRDQSTPFIGAKRSESHPGNIRNSTGEEDVINTRWGKRGLPQRGFSKKIRREKPTSTR